jgi:hypothetical protein
MGYPIPIRHVKSCKYCTYYKGDPKLIPPQDLQYAIRMPTGDYKCLTCQEEEIQNMIIASKKKRGQLS